MSLGRLTWRTDSGRCAPLVRPPGQPPLGRIAFLHEFPWAVFSGFCPRPPPAGQYVLVFVCLLHELLQAAISYIHS